MTVGEFVAKVRRGLKKPPRYIAQRVLLEAQLEWERLYSWRRAKGITALGLVRAEGHASIDAWWEVLGRRPALAPTDVADYDAVCAGDRQRIMAAAADASRHRVDLLGSGPIDLGEAIDWHRDYKTHFRWEPAYCRDISYNNLHQPSDVKFPWEVSRMQWMIPLGQAYLLTGDESYATHAKALVASWIQANPYAHSVNWACTMDVALRVLSWTWFFHAFKDSEAWREREFRGMFLRALYLHGDFIGRNLEKSDVNGNHYTADAAGLVFAGLFFGVERWSSRGWAILCEQLPLQVFPDGVDFESSVPYHRLVHELFLLPAMYRRRHGLVVPAAYRQRLVAMARFIEGYSRPDGSVPLWGDADDGRALPFGAQPVNDHRYLLGIDGLEWQVPELAAAFSGSRAEVAWLLGTRLAATLPARPAVDARSVAFHNGGFYVLRGPRDHVFIDCGPVGLDGRGGHGHNDLMSFEAMLDGIHLVTDCGAYVYTADYIARNRFRSTAYHNTPQVDGEEINRFIRPEDLWHLHEDARHELVTWELADETTRFMGRHTGYLRLPDPVEVTRELILDTRAHSLVIVDRLRSSGIHTVEIPLHLAPGVEIANLDDTTLLLGGRFRCTWSGTQAWTVEISQARISPSYGVAVATKRIAWKARWRGDAELRVSITS